MQTDQGVFAGRVQDAALHPAELRQMPYSPRDRRATEEEPCRDRADPEAGLRRRPGAAARAGRTVAERSAGLVGRASRGDAEQKGRLDVRYVERQRARAMIF